MYSAFLIDFIYLRSNYFNYISMSIFKEKREREKNDIILLALLISKKKIGEEEKIKINVIYYGLLSVFKVQCIPST